MKRTILTVLALASLGLVTFQADQAQAAWFHSGWWSAGTWRNYALSGSNHADFAVGAPFTDAGRTISANTSVNTWHWATTLCSNGVEILGFQHPFTNPYPNPTFGTTVGGLPNHNRTNFCVGSSQWAGGVWLWQ